MLTSLPAFSSLKKEYQSLKKTNMRELFARDKQRAEKFSIEYKDLFFDYSKNIITGTTLKTLIKLANESSLNPAIKAMFSGEKINTTEKRAVLHTALRNRSGKPVYVDGKDVMPEVKEVLKKMKAFSDAVRKDKTITDIVNIGIGGSDLGPKMVTEALHHYAAPNLRTHFVSNVDGTDITEVLKGIKPESTLFIISSKTFTTQETLTNATTARNWLVKALGEKAVAKHFVAISTNAEKVKEFGINPDNMFVFWDWVGGRYSLWSAIGLSIAIAIGFDKFSELLDGAFAMDEHFKSAPFAENIPVIMGLLSVWYYDFWGARVNAVLPYDEYLRKLPAYLQQLQMESNGKSVDKQGNRIRYATGAVLFGESGTNGQHSFYQLIHQGTQMIPCDFIAPAISLNETGDHHSILLANFLAQPEALMMGKSKAEVLAEGTPKDLVNQKVFTGNRPSNTILVDKMTPFNLGMILAMYEHKIFVEGVLWNIDSFDQWGVELGKQLAKKILPELQGDVKGRVKGKHDSSTSNLIARINKIRKKGLK